ncbi:MAG: hypothetical protein CMJ28_03630 [Phycisphaerae bacterium]|nr:hypothetical protein [Phycisphaerae bacterium]
MDKNSIFGEKSSQPPTTQVVHKSTSFPLVHNSSAEPNPPLDSPENNRQNAEVSNNHEVETFLLCDREGAKLLQNPSVRKAG